MATTFDTAAARERQNEIVREVQWIRDGINKDVIDYYYDRYPESEADEKRHRDDMRKYLRQAADRIRELLEGKLY